MNRRVAVYMGTRNYYPLMAAAAKSLLYHTRMDRVWFLIEDDAFPESFCGPAGLPDVIRTKNMSGQTWFRPDGPNYASHWTYMCLLPLALPEIFPEESRVLRIDDDTIVEHDIGDLFETDLTDNYCGMVEEPIRSSFPFRYYNAGVCLMNLDKFRETGIYKKMIRLANSQALTAVDQDALNVFCQGQIVDLDPAWNWCPGIIQDAPNPHIRHFAGCTRHRGDALFDKYSNADWRVKDD